MRRFKVDWVVDESFPRFAEQVHLAVEEIGKRARADQPQIGSSNASVLGKRAARWALDMRRLFGDTDEQLQHGIAELGFYRLDARQRLEHELCRQRFLHDVIAESFDRAPQRPPIR